jgi:hypothetical protein
MIEGERTLELDRASVARDARYGCHIVLVVEGVGARNEEPVACLPADDRLSEVDAPSATNSCRNKLTLLVFWARR